VTWIITPTVRERGIKVIGVIRVIKVLGLIRVFGERSMASITSVPQLP
jgi:hypothetical protein